jgi:uncharacterized protein YcfJ
MAGLLIGAVVGVAYATQVGAETSRDILAAACAFAGGGAAVGHRVTGQSTGDVIYQAPKARALTLDEATWGRLLLGVPPSFRGLAKQERGE